MCGIVGAINLHLNSNQLKKAMLHRGPDEQQGTNIENVHFYHFRLSILDIEGGKQPMHLHDRYTIIFNGQIYNHNDLRKKYNLKAQTSSDTETLLLLYAMKGPDFLDEVDGMFALAIYDKQEKTLFLARDRAGKKPLYLYQKGNQFGFASELNCLNSMFDLEIEEKNIAQYVRLGYCFNKNTPYKNVEEMPAGSFMFINTQTLERRAHSWWNIHDFYQKKANDSFEEGLEKVDGFLQAAVKRRMESSDLEVGSFLSGGIDSGLVTAIGAGLNDKLKTFTVCFSGQYDEGPLAKLVAEKYNTDHTEIHIAFDNLEQDVEQILANYGEPFFDSSAIPSYYVSKEAKKHLTVILNGDGADELFGGYRRYVPFSKYDFFNSNPIIQQSSKLLNRFMPLPRDKKSLYNYAYRLADFARKDGIETYISATTDIFEGFNQYLIPFENSFDSFTDNFNKIANSNLTGLQKIMNLDFDNILAGDLLVKMDIATMANSLEGRSPFLCKELLEYSPQMADNQKIRGGQTKAVLRELAKKYLPDTLISQPKRGFEIPLKNWVEKDLRDMIFDYILKPDAMVNHFIQPAFLKKMAEGNANVPPEKRAKMLWTLFALEVWYEKAYKKVYAV